LKPGSVETVAVSINPSGEITGSYLDTTGVEHGFLRAPDGTLETFDPAGSRGTFPASINPAGTITGFQEAGIDVHGFFRSREARSPPSILQAQLTRCPHA
jgi:hypothetical protein